MQKKYKEEDLQYFLEEFKRTQIRTDFMLVVGYPTETIQDFEQTLELLRRYQSYSNEGVINHVRIVPLEILPNSPLWKMRRQLGVDYAGDDIEDWRRGALDRSERMRRYNHARSFALSLGYKIRAAQDLERSCLFSVGKAVTFPNSDADSGSDLKKN